LNITVFKKIYTMQYQKKISRADLLIKKCSCIKIFNEYLSCKLWEEHIQFYGKCLFYCFFLRILCYHRLASFTAKQALLRRGRVKPCRLLQVQAVTNPSSFLGRGEMRRGLHLSNKTWTLFKNSFKRTKHNNLDLESSCWCTWLWQSHKWFRRNFKKSI
jgi:hypothetical protein